jgi:hypothetical protein
LTSFLLAQGAIEELVPIEFAGGNMTLDELWFADNPSRRYRIREATRPEADAVRAELGHKERSAALHFWRIVRRDGTGITFASTAWSGPSIPADTDKALEEHLTAWGLGERQEGA